MDRRSCHGSSGLADGGKQEPCGNVSQQRARLPCSICLDELCRKDVQENSSSDEIVICTTAWDNGRAVIPCKARDHFNSLVGLNVEMVTSEGIPFSMDVVKKPDKTYIEGDWPLFHCLYNLDHPDTVKLLYKHRIKGFHIKPYNPRGFLKQPDNKKVGMSVDDLILQGCLYTARMNTFSSSERERLINMLIEIEQPSLRPLVHRLTPTNIYKGELKLQRKFATLLKLQGSGYIKFSLAFHEESTPIGYKVSTDGRALCRWFDLMQEWELDPDDLAVFQPYFDASGPSIKVYIP